MSSDLFASSTRPPLPVGDNLIDGDQERALIAFIDQTGLEPFRFQGWLGKRLTASFGWSYDFEHQRIAAERPIPHQFTTVRDRMAAFVGVAASDFVQALVIRYDAGAGIGWHRDRPHFDKIVGLSLGARALLRLRRRGDDGKFDRYSVPLEPRSAYLLDGEVRHEWEHSIAPIAQSRWSITFRTLSDLGRHAIA